MFYLNKADVKSLAKALTKSFRPKHPGLAQGFVLDALAVSKGYADWNAHSASFSEEAVNRLLAEHELAHAQDSGMSDILGDGGFGPETSVQVHNGFFLRAPSFETCPEGADYVRVCDPLGREIAYWSHLEWRDDPMSVMGAILGALVRGGAAKMPEHADIEEVTYSIQDVPFDRLEAVIFGGRRYAVLSTDADALAMVLRKEPLSEAEQEEHSDTVVLSLEADDDRLIFIEEQFTVDFLCCLQWDTVQRAFVDSDGSPYVFVLVTEFGRRERNFI